MLWMIQDFTAVDDDLKIGLRNIFLGSNLICDISTIPHKHCTYCSQNSEKCESGLTYHYGCCPGKDSASYNKQGQ